MKVIIAGSRTIDDYNEVELAMKESGFSPTEIVSGGARGVDQLGEAWAVSHGIPFIQFIPDWETQGRYAGFLRNIQMADYADAAVFCWDGQSKGTAQCISEMKKRIKPIHIHKAT